MFRWFGLAALAMALSTACASAMTMRVVDDEVILSGQVVVADGDQFKAILSEHPEIKLVLFWNSPGGASPANRAISAMIIEHKLNTAIGGYCLSACAEMFLAGVERNFTDVEPLASTSIGFHGNYGANGALDPEPRLQRLKAEVITRTDGKADPALVEKWVHFERPRTLRFVYPGAHPDPAIAVAFECYGGRPNRGDYHGCQPVYGTNALTMGIITSADVLHTAR
jgi:hypothetical protein